VEAAPSERRTPPPPPALERLNREPLPWFNRYGSCVLPRLNSKASVNMRRPDPRSYFAGCAPGYPPWVTEDLIQATLVVWQPYYDELLTRQDAIDMLLAASRLLSALSRREES
jgi:hypothetical protein